MRRPTAVAGITRAGGARAAGGARWIMTNRISRVSQGAHVAEWNNDCQIRLNVPDDLQVFTCLNYHEHDQAPSNEEDEFIDG